VITSAAVSFLDPNPTDGMVFRPLKIAFSDLIGAGVRGRKAGIEFPVSLDVIETYLRRKGYGCIDYAFLPNVAVPQKGRSDRLLGTLGLRGQEPYPVREARLWGINMMNYLQTPAFFSLLQAAGVPLRRLQRNTEHPLIVLGGHIWPNPLPLADYCDVMAVGDGENVLERIAGLLEEFPDDRNRLLEKIARLEGAYVPGHTNRPVRKVWVDYSDPIFPAGGHNILNGTGSILLSRGCAYTCAFCMSSVAGWPYRVKPIRQIQKHIDRLQQAGAHTIVPVAASASLYNSNDQTAADVVEYIQARGMTVKPMSDRPENFTADYLSRITQAAGKVVIAPEASPRIRRLVFQKTIREETIDRAVSACIHAGIQRIQLYVILAAPSVPPGKVEFLPDGFDGEQTEDLRYLADLGRTIADRMIRAGLEKAGDKPFVLLDCMPFIPAIGSALQRVRVPAYGEYLSRIRELTAMIDPRYEGLVEVSAAMDEHTHLLQAFLERGDARAGGVIRQVWEQASGESLRLEDTQQAIHQAGIETREIFSDFLDRRLPYEGLIELPNA
jgi:hypothetical protein